MYWGGRWGVVNQTPPLLIVLKKNKKKIWGLTLFLGAISLLMMIKYDCIYLSLYNIYLSGATWLPISCIMVAERFLSVFIYLFIIYLIYLSGATWLPTRRTMVAERFLSLSSQCVRYPSGGQNSWVSKVRIFV